MLGDGTVQIYQSVSKRVYLAGGMHSDWRKVIIKKLGGSVCFFSFIDPMGSKMKNPDQYTFWDLRSIEHCDILVGHMDQLNPSGYGLNLEIGYAKALGKTIILIIPEDFTKYDERSRYFDMARVCADVVVKTLYGAADFLKAIEHV
jgi:nucleoside 2-deoxyribosyltransferase